MWYVCVATWRSKETEKFVNLIKCSHSYLDVRVVCVCFSQMIDISALDLRNVQLHERDIAQAAFPVFTVSSLILNGLSFLLDLLHGSDSKVLWRTEETRVLTCSHTFIHEKLKCYGWKTSPLGWDFPITSFIWLAAEWVNALPRNQEAWCGKSREPRAVSRQPRAASEEIFQPELFLFPRCLDTLKKGIRLF